jgi:hypothetical protein
MTLYAGWRQTGSSIATTVLSLLVSLIALKRTYYPIVMAMSQWQACQEGLPGMTAITDTEL